MHLTNMGPVFLDTLANAFGLVLFTVIPGVDGQSLFDIHVGFFENCLACLTS